MSNVFDSIKSICKNELDINLTDLTEISDKLIDSGIDSIGLMTLVVYLEEKFNLEIDIDKIVQKAFTDICFADVISLVDENE